MLDLGTVLWTALALYALMTGVFIILENRRPPSTLAWMLLFVFAPGVGLLVYLFFGRDRKPFSKRSDLLRQALRADALPVLAPLRAREDAEVARVERESPAHRKLLALVRRNSYSTLTGRNRVEILQDAAEFYPRLVKDMQAARHSIHHQYFIWRSDALTEQWKKLLIERAREGVEVRLLYDPVGSHLRRAYARELRTGGVRVAPTSPAYRLHNISYRNHRKISVIDGEVGYTGGMNIGQEHVDGGEGFDAWRDTQVRVVGDGVAALQTVFAVDWYNAVAERLFAPAYFPAAATASPAGGVPVQILTSGPDSEWAAIRQLYATMIVAAQRRVRLQSPFFIPDATVAEALTTAAMSGVDVQLMVSARPSGNTLPDWAGNTYLADVAAAGVKVFLYEKGYLHAKTISIDSEICSIGSTNIDIRSFSIDYELNAVLYDAPLARELEEDFDRDLAGCRAFDLGTYRRRSAASRFRDSAARLVSPLL
jgi:cardiolipin synthase